MNDLLRQATVCVLTNKRNIAGTGFFVAETYVLTCAHVVREINVSVGDSLKIVTYKGEQNAIVVLLQESNEDDIALLQLSNPPSDTCLHLLLGSSGGTSGHSFVTFAYPTINKVEGMFGYGKIGGQVTLQGSPRIQLTEASEVSKGYSGAPVFDITSKRVIGVISNVSKPDHLGRFRETAFAIPTESLLRPHILNAFPLLAKNDICPYQGLAAFTEKDAPFFFGREELIATLSNQLRQSSRFLALVGPSGSGKTSVIQAGLFPSLRDGAVLDSQKWRLIFTRPHGDPYAGLQENELVLGSSERLIDAVIRCLKNYPSASRLLLCIDQFEELFTLCTDETQQRFFHDLLEVMNSSVPITIVISLRSDFYDRLQGSPLKYDWTRIGLVDVLSMRREEMETAIVKPAEAIGLRFETGLVSIILDEVMGVAQPLPLLEFVLTQLWAKRQDGELKHEAYRVIGRVGGAVSQWGEDTYNELTSLQQSIARIIFLRLIYLGQEDRNDTRQTRTLEELVMRSEERNSVYHVVQHLTNRRLLTTSQLLNSNRETVEIIHDALLHQWQRLRLWREDNREFLLWHQQLENDIAIWKHQDLDEGLLLSDKRLDIAEIYLSTQKVYLNEDEQAFIQASAIKREREQLARRRLTQRIIVGLVVAIIILASLTIVALTQRQNAVRESNSRATAQAEVISESNARATEIVLRTTAEISARNEANIRATAESEAVAEANARATEAALRAQAQAQAEQERGNAETQRQIAVARQLAEQSQTILTRGEPRQLPLSVLLAIESVRHAETAEGDSVLRQSLGMLPQVILRTRVEPENTELLYANEISKIEFSSGGKWLAAVASAAQYETVVIWDTATWEQKLQVRGSELLSFTNDEQFLVIISQSRTLSMWNVATGKLRFELDHPERINAFSLSYDNKLISIVSDNVLVIWDSDTGSEVNRLEIGGDIVQFSPDSQLLALGINRSLSILHAVTGETLVSNTPNDVDSVLQPVIRDIKFSPDSEQIFVAEGEPTNEGTIPRSPVPGRVYALDLKTNTQDFEINYSDAIRSLDISPDGLWLVVAGYEGIVNTINLETSVPVGRFVYGNPVDLVKFISNGQRVLIAGTDGSIRLWEVKTNQEISRFGENVNVSFNNVIAIHQNLVAGEPIPGQVWVWHISDSAMARMNHGLNVSISYVDISDDGELVATGSWDKTARIYDIESAKLLHQISFDSKVIMSIFRPASHHLVVSSLGGEVRVIDSANGEDIIAPLTFSNTVSSLAFSPDGRYLAIAEGIPSRDGWFLYRQIDIQGMPSVHIWDLELEREHSRISIGKTVNSIDFSPDGLYIATGSIDSAQVWSIESGSLIATLPHEAPVRHIKFSLDGNLIATASAEIPGFLGNCGRAKLTLWHLPTVKIIWQVNLPGSWIPDMEFSPNGNAIATASNYIACSGNLLVNAVVVWDTLTGNRVSQVDHGHHIIIDISFNANGDLIASGGGPGQGDGLVRVWDPTTERISIQIPYWQAWSLDFAPDSSFLAVGGYSDADTYLQLLYLDTENLISEACSRLLRNMTQDEWRLYLGDEPYRETCSLYRYSNEPSDDSVHPIISADGRFVVFESDAENLVLDDNNNNQDIFIFDRESKELKLVSVNSDGVQGDQPSSLLDISNDARFVLFSSRSGILIRSDYLSSTDESDCPGLFLRDISLGTTFTVLDPTLSICFERAKVSSDGRYVVFSSSSSIDVQNDTNEQSDIYMFDRAFNKILLISKANNGESGNGKSDNPSISANGRFIVFKSSANNLSAANISRSGWYLFDRLNGQITWLFEDGFTYGFIYSNSLYITNDGQRLYGTMRVWEERILPFPQIFSTDNVFSEPIQIFSFDRGTNSFKILSANSDGILGDGNASFPSLRADERFVVFSSSAPNLVSDDDNLYSDIFILEQGNEDLIRVTKSVDRGLLNGHSFDPSIDKTGCIVAFSSQASNLVVNDNNGFMDIFIYDCSSDEFARITPLTNQ